jgi:hypothetical protein
MTGAVEIESKDDSFQKNAQQKKPFDKGLNTLLLQLRPRRPWWRRRQMHVQV